MSTFTAQGTTTDTAGNSATASFGPIQIDKRAPTITAGGTKADGISYTLDTWTNQNVTVRFTCHDADAGMLFCSGDQVISPDGTHTSVGTMFDNAGNTATVSYGPMKIDKTAPTTSGSANVAARRRR